MVGSTAMLVKDQQPAASGMGVSETTKSKAGGKEAESEVDATVNFGERRTLGKRVVNVRRNCPLSAT